MQNITIILMRTNYLLSVSSLFSIPQFSLKKETSIFKSYFSHSFSNIIYSNFNNYNMNIINNFFTYNLNTSIFIAKSSNTELLYQKFQIPQNFTEYSLFGNITIVDCIFEKCISDIGGGICVFQKCSIMIHGTFFNQCRAKDGGGGYIGALYKYRNENIDSTEFALSAIIQYCCFNECFAHYYTAARIMGFGSELLIASEKTIISYVSGYNSTYNDEITYGAQFDIHSSFTSTKYLNITKTIATFAGSIEFRQIQSGEFKFNTISNIECKYGTTFILYGKIDFSSCNYVGNYIRGNPNGVSLPAIICQDFKKAAYLQYMFDIVDTFFFQNEYAERCSITQAFTNKGTITLVNCFSDKYTITEVDDIKTINCNLNYGDNLKLSIFPQINLGECEGDYDVPDFFSPSLFFSDSGEFTFSKKFTSSEYFSNSVQFSISNEFSGSDEFSFSEKFSETYIFSNTDHFSLSNIFSISNFFTKSNQFSFSDRFSKTQVFSNSDHFTFSDRFSDTNIFSNTCHFSLSNIFSISNTFTKSNIFSKTEAFSNSNQFSFSRGFSDSIIYTKSALFSASKIFILTKMFTNSYYFSHNQFSNCNNFTFDQDTSSSILNFSSSNLSKRTSLLENYILSLTISITYVSRRSVSFSLSFSSSNSLSYTYFGNEYLLISTQSIYQWTFPYIINYLSQSYVKVYVPVYVFKKKTISREQLIGVVCGSTSIFFLIIGIIIIASREKKKEYNDFVCDYSEDEKRAKNKESIKNELSVSNYSSDDDLNFWL